MKGYLLAISAFLTCPCHIPLYVALLGGTAVGGLLASYQGWVLLGMSAYFAGALLFGIRLLRRRGEPIHSQAIPAAEARMEGAGRERRTP